MDALKKAADAAEKDYDAEITLRQRLEDGVRRASARLARAVYQTQTSVSLQITIPNTGKTVMPWYLRAVYIDGPDPEACVKIQRRDQKHWVRERTFTLAVRGPAGELEPPTIAIVPRAFLIAAANALPHLAQRLREHLAARCMETAAALQTVQGTVFDEEA